MAKKWQIWKASGKVTYFVDDITAPSKKRALEIATDTVGSDIEFAADKGNIELLELKVEPLRPATKEEIQNAGGPFDEEWAIRQGLEGGQS